MLRKRKRSRLEIASQILKLCRAPQHLYKLMRLANLSYTQARMMLDYLLLRGFLEECVHGKYIITDFGTEFAGSLQTVIEVWNIPQIILHDPCHVYSLSLSD